MIYKVNFLLHPKQLRDATKFSIGDVLNTNETHCSLNLIVAQDF